MSDNKNGSKYTFDSFAVTDANRTAFEKAKQFAENADSEPLAIFGGTATGKTHLLYAVKNAIEQNSPDLKVILTTTADMVSTLTSTISNGGTTEQFREKYLQADVLLVDDIQELAGKEKTQDELLLLFNAFCESGKRFMMTSSQKEAGYGIQDRLVIREFWGDFAVITRAYIHAQFESNAERINQRKDLLHKSEQFCWNLMHDADFDIDAFKAYYKEVWAYFSRYIGLFDADREDLKIVCYLNRMDTLLHCKTPVGLKSCEWNTCILFMHALIYTISSYDMIPYLGGFCGNGVLSIPMLHHAGYDRIEITIDEFEEEFNKFCEGYQRSRRSVRRLHWRFD
ncbi:DnaA ATPase domain-containing protein [Ruminococcus sp. XPD3002]|uniref:DnaA ATPase domain-containing protein n=1 Tax=Ruminococcus sp. XPD3002 TaxID=1452269 RepID=UPI0009149814|nr:dnaA protein [Ruminococcus flavefaciens]